MKYIVRQGNITVEVDAINRESAIEQAKWWLDKFSTRSEPYGVTEVTK